MKGRHGDEVLYLKLRPVKKRSKTELREVRAEEVENRKSQQKRIPYLSLVEMVPTIDTAIAANRIFIDAYRLVDKRTVSIGTISTRPWDNRSCFR